MQKSKSNRALVLSIIIFCCSCTDVGKREAENLTKTVAAFKQHKVDFDKLLQHCINQPFLKYVNAKNGDFDTYGIGANAVNIDNSVKNTMVILHEVNGLSLRCSRRGEINEYPFIAASITMFATGITVSGHSTSIVYLSLSALENKNFSPEKLKQRGYIELDAPHWFAVSQEH